MRPRIPVLMTVIALLLTTPHAGAGTCQQAYLTEGSPLPAFTGINTTDTGFTASLWAWGANPSDQGSMTIGLIDDGAGIAISPGFLWANSDACSGEIVGTGLLVEAQTAANGGKLALVALGPEGQVDTLQQSTGQSVAQTIPVPAVSTAGYGADAYGDYVDFRLSWSAPSGGAWALSELTPVLAGYAVYLRAGAAVNNGDKAAFTRLDTAASGSVPSLTNDSDTDDGLLPATQTSCQVRLRYGTTYYFALALILDGTGAVASDPQADASAVESSYVSACSAPVNAAAIFIFADGFETGSTSAWSESVP